MAIITKRQLLYAIIASSCLLCTFQFYVGSTHRRRSSTSASKRSHVASDHVDLGIISSPIPSSKPPRSSVKFSIKTSTILAEKRRSEEFDGRWTMKSSIVRNSRETKAVVRQADEPTPNYEVANVKRRQSDSVEETNFAEYVPGTDQKLHLLPEADKFVRDTHALRKWELRLENRVSQYKTYGCCRIAPALPPQARSEDDTFQLVHDNRTCTTALVNACSPAQECKSLPVYWINLDSAEDRADFMRKQLSQLHGIQGTRISAATPASTTSMENDGSLTVHAHIIDRCGANGDCFKFHSRPKPKFSRVELSCTISHLLAIETAYKNGDDFALILEDDLVLPEYLKESIDEILPQCPPDWGIIQLTPKSAGVLKQLVHIVDPFVRWMPQYFGTGSYLISRSGMKALLSKFSSIDHESAKQRTFVLPHDVLVADELLYMFCSSYTYTRLIIGFADPASFPSAIHRSGWAIAQKKSLQTLVRDSRATCKPLLKPKFLNSERSPLLIVNILRDCAQHKMNALLEALDENIKSTSNWRFHFHLLVVLHEIDVKGTSSPTRRSIWESAISAMPGLRSDTVSIEYIYSSDPDGFPDWHFYRAVALKADIYSFDNVVLANPMMDFVGFAWTEFFLRLKSLKASGRTPVLTGVAHQSYAESKKTTLTPRNAQFHTSDGRYWHNCNRWDISAFDTDLVDTNFAVYNTQFFLWFLEWAVPDYLEDRLKYLKNDFGVQFVACGAAREFYAINNGMEVCADNRTWTDKANLTCKDWTGWNCEDVSEYCDEDLNICFSPADLTLLNDNCCATCRLSQSRCFNIPLIMRRRDYVDPNNRVTLLRDPPLYFSDATEKNLTYAQTFGLYKYEFPEWFAGDFLNRYKIETVNVSPNKDLPVQNKPPSCETDLMKDLEILFIDHLEDSISKVRVRFEVSKQDEMNTIASQHRRSDFLKNAVDVINEKSPPLMKLLPVKSSLPEMTRSVIPAYWINLAEASKRRTTMKNMFKKISTIKETRIEAIDRQEVRKMKSNGSLVLFGKLVENCGATYECIKGRKNKPPQYTTGEIGCTVSHIRAIATAFANEDQLALILEDDVILNESIADALSYVQNSAPQNWEIIQFGPKSARVLRQFRSIRDPFVSWMPQHYGTSSYLINRRGMKSLLDKYAYFGNSSGNRKLEKILLTGSLAVADEMIYEAANTYTFTRSVSILLSEHDYPSTLQKFKLGSTTLLDSQQCSERVNNPVVVPSAGFDHRVLVSMVFRDKSTDGSMSDTIPRDVASLANNIQSTVPWGFYYYVFVILASEGSKKYWEIATQQYDQFNGNTTIEYIVNPNRFSKWIYFSKVSSLADIDQYSDVLFVDSDLDFTGFPWGEFFLRHFVVKPFIQQQIVGVPRQSFPQESFNSWYPHMDGEFWISCNRDKYLAAPIDFVEQYFALMDVKFMKWFFSHFLSDNFLELHRSLKADFGIDGIWCGAAREYHRLITADLPRCVNNITFIDRHGYSCEDWHSRDCTSISGFCNPKHPDECYDAKELDQIRHQCCSCWRTGPKCLVIPLVINHKDTRSLTGNRFKSTDFKNFSKDGNMLANIYADAFPDWHRYSFALREFARRKQAWKNCKDFADLNPPLAVLNHDSRWPWLAERLNAAVHGSSSVSAGNFSLNDPCPELESTANLAQYDGTTTVAPIKYSKKNIGDETRVLKGLPNDTDATARLSFSALKYEVSQAVKSNNS